MCNRCVELNLRKYLNVEHKEPEILDEETYKDFLREINPNNLPHRDFSKLIPFVKYVGTRKNVMKYFVPNKYNGWNTYIEFMDWNEQLHDTSLNPNEVAKLILWAGNVKLHCQCPAYKFWGMQYILTQRKAAIIPEVRMPHVNNPYLKGVVCKHLNRTLKVLPFHLGDMANAIRVQRAAQNIK